MLTLRHGLRGVICALGLLTTACAARTSPVVSVQPVAPDATTVSALAAPQPEPDPVVALIARTEGLLQSGEQALREGRLGQGREAFDEAFDLIHAWPGGPHSDSRLVAQLDYFNERTRQALSSFEAESGPIAGIAALLTAPPPEAPPATPPDTDEDLPPPLPDVEIPTNQRVQSFIELFTGRLKGYLQEGLSRGARYLPMIQRVFRAEGLPLDLAYVPLIESAFKPNAVSRAKATGMWQFMRGTALENGLKHDWYIDERADPEKATRAAANYLKTLYAMFNDWPLALASYNAGPGRVQRAIKRSGRDDFWKVSATSRFLPRETRDYVPLILAAIVVAGDPARYGLEITPLDEPAYETVTVAGAVDLRRVAEWASVPVEGIRDLNPELRRWTTPVRAVDYELKVPQGTADAISARLAGLGSEEFAPLSLYTVKKGETLVSIAKKLKVTRADLAEANYLSTRAKLKTGQELIVPRPPVLVAGGSARPQVDAVRASLQIDTTDEVTPDTTTHRVRRGETLFSIARRYNTSVASLKEWNGLSGNVIQIGQRLTIHRQTTLATN